jgi:hypothetical protein
MGDREYQRTMEQLQIAKYICSWSPERNNRRTSDFKENCKPRVQMSSLNSKNKKHKENYT